MIRIGAELSVTLRIFVADMKLIFTIILSMSMFFGIENMADHADYRIFKYLVQLKTFDLDEFCVERAERAGEP